MRPLTVALFTLAGVCLVVSGCGSRPHSRLSRRPTGVANDSVTQEPKSFLAGYAIKQGGQEIVEWSVW